MTHVTLRTLREIGGLIAESVLTSTIAAEAVTTPKIENNAVTAIKIAKGVVPLEHGRTEGTSEFTIVAKVTPTGTIQISTEDSGHGAATAYVVSRESGVHFKVKVSAQCFVNWTVWE